MHLCFRISPCLPQLKKQVIGVSMNPSCGILKSKINSYKSCQSFSNLMTVQCQRPPPYGKPIRLFFRGKCISAGSHLKQESTLQKMLLLDQLRTAELRLLLSPMVDRLHAVILRNHIKSLDMSNISKSMFWATQKMY